jgi:hypothetical protein
MRYGLWKSVENFSGIGVAGAAERAPRHRSFYSGVEASQPSQDACSSCAGDYEDPDRTAWTTDEEEGECNDEFPAVER